MTSLHTQEKGKRALGGAGLADAVYAGFAGRGAPGAAARALARPAGWSAAGAGADGGMISSLPCRDFALRYPRAVKEGENLLRRSRRFGYTRRDGMAKMEILGGGVPATVS